MRIERVIKGRGWDCVDEAGGGGIPLMTIWNIQE